MSIQANRDRHSVLTDLMDWMGAPGMEPQVRVEEWVEGDRRIIRADIPGVDPTKDIELTVEGGMLHLRGQRRAETHDQHRSEIRYGSFARVIALPAGTRAEDVAADYSHGVLTVSMPAGRGGGSQSIPITSGEQRSSSDGSSGR
ncbi:Hsp20/alpha crystallin family protein [Nocardioides sp. cx-169]|uniref:Hsp20/alpha crystallin family protein n=1 Tax=Nocardioides sp. cx-169 TaxID=2899080 RepID=UPI001E5CD332|nr:Hsp20/alpha crystallin family protein [Nocardioides sp. cx-169]MCD4533301.1 Hsp20/alpha crystallin family protein [Nocardioides sp. cx-169]